MKYTILSTFAKDNLITDTGIVTRSGGPALFIKKVFDDSKLDYELITADEEALVEIDMRDNREVGFIKKVSKINFKNRPLEFILISTVLDEAHPISSAKYSCIDIQGYVRNKRYNGDFGMDLRELSKFTVVKGTEQECSYLPNDVLNNINLLLKTKGEKGFYIKTKAFEKEYSVDKIVTPDTIGAGDTFFSAFCIKYSQTENIEESAEFAKKTVYNFLQQKNR